MSYSSGYGLRKGLMMKHGLLWGVCILFVMAVLGCGSQGMVPEGDRAVKATRGTSGQDKNERGIIEYQKRNWERAEDYFRAAIETNPQLGEAHYNLGLVLDKRGIHAKAAASFRKAVDIGSPQWVFEDSVMVKDHIGI